MITDHGQQVSGVLPVRSAGLTQDPPRPPPAGPRGTRVCGHHPEALRRLLDTGPAQARQFLGRFHPVGPGCAPVPGRVVQDPRRRLHVRPVQPRQCLRRLQPFLSSAPFRHGPQGLPRLPHVRPSQPGQHVCPEAPLDRILAAVRDHLPEDFRRLRHVGLAQGGQVASRDLPVPHVLTFGHHPSEGLRRFFHVSRPTRPGRRQQSTGCGRRRRARRRSRGGPGRPRPRSTVPGRPARSRLPTAR